jgi:TFIIF-interacting CTD phosphatase-like protein
MIRPGESLMTGQGFFSYLLSFKECLYSRDNEIHLKDLKILESNRNLSDIVIVDNCVKSFYLHMDNGIPIYDFEGDPSDKALFHLTVYLKSLMYEEDVRTKIAVDFGIRPRPNRG